MVEIHKINKHGISFITDNGGIILIEKHELEYNRYHLKTTLLNDCVSLETANEIINLVKWGGSSNEHIWTKQRNFTSKYEFISR